MQKKNLNTTMIIHGTTKGFGVPECEKNESKTGLQCVDVS